MNVYVRDSQGSLLFIKDTKQTKHGPNICFLEKTLLDNKNAQVASVLPPDSVSASDSEITLPSSDDSGLEQVSNISVHLAAWSLSTGPGDLSLPVFFRLLGLSVVITIV